MSYAALRPGKHRSVTKIKCWAVGKKKGGFFLQNGIPFLCASKYQAKNWCEADEAEIPVVITIRKRK